MVGYYMWNRREDYILGTITCNGNGTSTCNFTGNNTAKKIRSNR